MPNSIDRSRRSDFNAGDDDGWCSSKLFTFYMFVERLTILALSASFIQMSYRVVCHYRSELLLRVKKCSSHLDIFWFIGVLMLWMGRQKSKLLKVCSICYSIRNFSTMKHSRHMYHTFHIKHWHFAFLKKYYLWDMHVKLHDFWTFVGVLNSTV